MAAATLFAQPYWEAPRDATGAIRVGAKLYVYDTGTSTPAVVYHDADLMTPWTQPIVSNASGISDDPIFCDTTPLLKVAVTDAADVALPGFPMDPWAPYLVA